MKTTKKFYYYALSLLGAALILFISCKKENIPVLSTTEVTRIFITTATTGGNIIDDGGATVTARGVCWSTSQNPTTSDSKTIALTVVGWTVAGSFTSSISGLEPNTMYYVRAYATNSEGTGYGNALSFTTLEEVSDADGNVYSTVVIDNQEWFAENLKTTKYNNGTQIPNVTSNSDWVNLTSGAYAWYENNEATYKNAYGALYNWYAVSTGNLCPTGWRVPTDDDWKNLEGTVDSYFDVGDSVWNDYGLRGWDAGTKLKATSGWNSGGNGTDDFGFSALPVGSRYSDFGNVGDYGRWWSSAESDATNAWYRGMYYGNGTVYRINTSKRVGFSVRCLRDN